MRFAAFASGLIAALALATPTTRAQTAADFQKLGQTLTNMGYKPTTADNQVTFTNALGIYHGFVACGGGKIDAYVAGTNGPPEALPPAAVMTSALRYNNTHPTFFSLNQTGKTYNMVLNVCFEPEQIVPAALQEIIGLLDAGKNETADIWNPANWK